MEKLEKIVDEIEYELRAQLVWMEHSFGVYYLEAEMSDLLIAMEEEGLDVEMAKEDFSSKKAFVDKALDRCDVVAAEEADNEFLDELEKLIEQLDDDDSGLSLDVVAAEEADNEFLDELEKFIERRDDNDSGLSLDVPVEPSEKKDEDDEIYF